MFEITCVVSDSELKKVEGKRRQLYKWKGFLSCNSLKTEAIHRLLCS